MKKRTPRIASPTANDLAARIGANLDALCVLLTVEIAGLKARVAELERQRLS